MNETILIVVAIAATLAAILSIWMGITRCLSFDLFKKTTYGIVSYILGAIIVVSCVLLLLDTEQKLVPILIMVALAVNSIAVAVYIMRKRNRN